ncbi:NUDIX hydrolase [Streptomyces sp. OP7]|uniref:NUDIX hydrolase n=1 Tax=Streptomyces sp. OP7 TaxID=3142462 RepID=UPI0032E87994
MTAAARATTAMLLEHLADRQAGTPVTVTELGRLAGLQPAEASSAVPVVLALVSAFGVLREERTSDGTAAVVVVSPPAAYFLRGLAAYMRSDHAILDNWERPGTDIEPSTVGRALTGPQFLYLAEERRLALDPDAPPLRHADVVQVLVKAKLRGRGGRAQYLLQYDERARQYQLPGGHVRTSDASLRSAAARELEEELDGYTYRSDRDVLTELGVVDAVQSSRTYGAITDYRVTFFHLKVDAERLRPGPGARWVDESRLFDPDFRIGRASLNVTALSRLNATLPGGMHGLPWSIPATLHRRLGEVIKERPWEVAGLVLGVLGLAVSLMPMFLW